MWEKATSNQGGRGQANFVGTMDCTLIDRNNLLEHPKTRKIFGCAKSDNEIKLLKCCIVLKKN